MAKSNTRATADNNVVEDSNGNVLVGQTSNSETGTGIGLVPDGTSHMYSANTDTLMLGRGGSDGDILAFNRSGGTVGSIGAVGSRMYIGTGDTGLFFNDQLDSIDPWNTSTNSARDASIDIGDASRRFKDLYLSGGAYIGGTGSANKLDDYERGTHTPTFTNDSSVQPNFSFHQGYYVKVGRQVTVWFKVGFNGNLPSGNVFMSMPFAQGNDSGFDYPVSGIINNQYSNSSSLDGKTLVIEDYTSSNNQWCKLGKDSKTALQWSDIGTSGRLFGHYTYVAN